MRLNIKVILLIFLLLLLTACGNDSFSEEVVMPSSRICADRIIDRANPPSNYVVMGNSLLLGNGRFGLAASDSSKDYFSRIDSVFRSLNPGCIGKRVMAKNTENSLSDKELFSAISANISPSLSDSNDLVIIQLGDNIDTGEEIQRMKKTVGAIMDSVCIRSPSAKVVWVGEWYSSDRKQKILRQMADAYGVQFIDISDLNVKENQAKVGDIVEYPDIRLQSVKYEDYHVYGEKEDTLFISFKEDDQLYQTVIFIIDHYENPEKKQLDFLGCMGIVTDSFAATHPNNQGFKLIADRILEDLGF